MFEPILQRRWAARATPRAPTSVHSGTNIGTSTNIHPNNTEQFDIFSVDGDDVVSSAVVRPRVKAAQTDVSFPACCFVAAGWQPLDGEPMKSVRCGSSTSDNPTATASRQLRTQVSDAADEGSLEGIVDAPARQVDEQWFQGEAETLLDGSKPICDFEPHDMDRTFL